MYRLKSICSLTEFPMLVFELLVSENRSSILARLSKTKQTPQVMVKKNLWKNEVDENC